MQRAVIMPSRPSNTSSIATMESSYSSIDRSFVDFCYFTNTLLLSWPSYCYVHMRIYFFLKKNVINLLKMISKCLVKSIATWVSNANFRLFFSFSTHLGLLLYSMCLTFASPITHRPYTDAMMPILHRNATFNMSLDILITMYVQRSALLPIVISCPR